MALKSIQPARRRLADEVYDELIDAIMRREIGPDDNLIQEKLAAELQISRTPVREALMRLEQEGVLTVSNRGSFQLYQMDDQEVRELYQSRAAVDGAGDGHGFFPPIDARSAPGCQELDDVDLAHDTGDAAVVDDDRDVVVIEDPLHA